MTKKYLGVFAAALIAAPLAANAVTVNPNLGDTGSFSFNVCNSTSPICPQSSSISNPTGATVKVGASTVSAVNIGSFLIGTVSGVMNFGATNSVSPVGTGSYSAFSYYITDAADALNTALAAGGFGSDTNSPSNLGVNLGKTYNVFISYTFTGSANRPDSAGGSVTYSSAILRNAPEPASLALLGMGLAGLGIARRRRRLS